MSTRIPLKRVPWFVPMLALFGATARNSYIQIDTDTVTTRFGWHQMVIPRELIESASTDRWPWYGGLGWRTDFRRRYGLIGALSPIVRIDLNTSHRSRLLGIPIRFRELYVSVDSPEILLAALSA